MRRQTILSFLLLALLPSMASAQSTINTAAGGGPNNLPALSSSLAFPTGVATDSSANLYVAVQQDCRVYKVSPTGQLIVFAGTAVCGYKGDGGPAAIAELAGPSAVAVDASGNVFIADSGSSVVREVVGATGNIQTVAGNGTVGYSGDGGAATSAQLNFPSGVTVDSSGNIFIADTSNSVVREVIASTGIIRTVAGNGTSGYSGDGGLATAAQLTAPWGVGVDVSGNLFIADLQANVVREVIASSGIIQTVAGNGTSGYTGDGGPATSATLGGPYGVAVDASGNIFIADGINSVIREVAAATGNINTVAGNGTSGFSGNGGPATSAQLNQPLGIVVDASGNTFFPDFRNFVVWEVVAATGNIQVVAGNGQPSFSGDGQLAPSAELGFPQGLYLDGSGNMFLADSGNNVIRSVSASTGIINTVAGTGVPGYAGDGGSAINAQLSSPTGVVTDSSGNIFFADAGNNVIREVVAATGNIQTIAGNGTAGYSGDGGPATSATLNFPQDLKIDNSGNIFFSDSGNNVIREILAATGNIQTIAGTGTPGYTGDGGPAKVAQLSNPNGLFLDSSGNIFIADSNNNVVREIVAATGNIQTVAGNGTGGYTGDGGAATSAELNFPSAVYVDASGNLFIADVFNAVIRQVVASTGNIQTVAGNGQFDFSGDGGPALSAAIGAPFYIAPDLSGNYYIADLASNRVRKVSASGSSPSPAVSLSQTTLTFVTQTVASSSAAQTITLTNSGNATLTISGIAISGGNSGDFSESDNCGASVAAAANCTISVTFKPTANGARGSSVSITDNAVNSPQSVTLLGTGGTPASGVTLSTSNLAFSSQNLGTTSAAQTVTLTNSGNAALSVTSIAVSGGNSGDFSETNTCGNSVAAAASCTISVTFKPTATGARTASVTITDNASSSPHSVSLTGSGAGFALAMTNGTSNAATVQAGSTATYNLQLSPVGGFTGTVAITCTGAPAGATCTASPATLNATGTTAVPFAVNVTTTARSAAAAPLFHIQWPSNPHAPVFPMGSMILALVLAIAAATLVRAPKPARVWVPAAALLVCLSLLTGCGGGSPHSNNVTGTPAGTYALTVTATPQQGAAQSVTVSLIVQ
jgi:Abnormal spindle-like microcephaly-assoc'd, ASPM-SPD-2-Hydin/Cep192 domain 4/NHL repeat